MFNFNKKVLINFDNKAKEIEKKCSENIDKETCLTDQFKSLSNKYALSYTLSVLASLRKDDSNKHGCHFIAHVIGENEVLKNKGDWKSLIENIPEDDCTGGFIMGAIEGMKKFDNSKNLNSAAALEFCKVIGSTSDKAKSDFTCIHSIGHLFLIEKKGNVVNSLNECDLLLSVYQYECFSGVFMENIFRRNLLSHKIGKSLTWDSQTYNEQTKYCNTFSELKAKACWRELSHMIIDLANYDTVEITRKCLISNNKTNSEECINHAQSVLALLDKHHH